MMKKATFYTTLILAVADVEANGYDPARVENWVLLLIMLADESFKARQKKDVRAFFQMHQKRYLKPINMKKVHSDLNITLYPDEFQSELLARLAITDSLIEALRDRTIDDMTRQFIGWASSVVPGTKNKNSADVLKRINVNNISDHEIRIVYDQKDKMLESMGFYIAKKYGAICGVWHSLWRVPGYNYRADHKEKDLRYYFFREAAPVRAGFIRHGVSYVDDEVLPGSEINCKCHYSYLYDIRSIPAEYLSNFGKLHAI